MCGKVAECRPYGPRGLPLAILPLKSRQISPQGLASGQNTGTYGMAKNKKMKVNITVDHNLGQDEAVSRLKEYADELLDDSPNARVEVVWTDNKCHVEGVVLVANIEADMVVEPGHVDVKVKLPFIAIPFRSRIEKEIRTRIEDILA